MIPACPPPRSPSRPKIPLACRRVRHPRPCVRARRALSLCRRPQLHAAGRAARKVSRACSIPLGFARGVLVQGSAHGSDNSAMLDALARQPGRLRGVAVAGRGRAAGGASPLACARRARVAVQPFLPRWAAALSRRRAARRPRGCSRRSCRSSDWHLQLWIDVKDLPDTMPILQSLALPVVIDHMGRSDARAGTGTPGFQSLLRFLGAGGCWVKLSGAHRISRTRRIIRMRSRFTRRWSRENPDRLVWGGDWPHPRMDEEMPDVGPSARPVHAMDAGRRRPPAHPGHQSAAALRLSARHDDDSSRSANDAGRWSAVQNPIRSNLVSVTCGLMRAAVARCHAV